MTRPSGEKYSLPPALTMLIALPSFALVIYVPSAELEDSFISYIAYVLSAYSLAITFTGVILLNMNLALLGIAALVVIRNQISAASNGGFDPRQAWLVSSLPAGIKGLSMAGI